MSDRNGCVAIWNILHRKHRKKDTLMDTWKRERTQSRNIRKLSPNSSVVRAAWAGWNCVTLSTVFVWKFNFFFPWVSRNLKVAPIAFPSTSVRKYHFSFRNIPGDADLKFLLRLLLISFGLSQLNIAHHLKYTINLNISYYQTIRSRSSKQPHIFMLYWMFRIPYRNTLL